MDQIDAHAINDAKVVSESSTVEVERRISEAIFEYEALTKAGVEPDLSIFLARYADIQDELRACIEAKNFVDGAFGSNSQGQRATPQTQPTRLGDFLVLQKVGSGGMGEVYEAYEISLARRVALKVLSSTLAGNETSLKRFQQEAQAAATLQHPHIVPVFSVGQVDRNYFFAMQFVDGISLAEAMLRFRNRDHLNLDTASELVSNTSEVQSANPIDSSRGKVVNEQSSEETQGEGANSASHQLAHPLLNLQPKTPEYFRTIARLIQQAAEALQHAHERGIIHRDIKPSNLLVDLKENVWVADFGLARLPDSNLTAKSDVLGTVRYMSPEQASGRGNEVDGRSDVYSLGATLYELLTLRPLFESDDRRSMLRMVIETKPVAPKQHCSNLPNDLESIVLKAISKDLDHRYSSAQALADDLDRFLSLRPILAKPPALSQILWKWINRNLAVTLGLVGLVVIVLLVTVITTTIALNRISKANRLANDANNQLVNALEEKDSSLYHANMILARHDWDNGSHEGARSRLDATSQRYRMWEWQYMNSVCNEVTKKIDNEQIVDVPWNLSSDGYCMIRLRPDKTEAILTIDFVPPWNGQAKRGLRFKPIDKGFTFSARVGYYFCKSGAYVASIDADKLITVLSTKTGDLLHQLSLPHPIRGNIAVMDDGNVLAPLLVGEKIEIWDVGNLTKLADVIDTKPVKCWSPDLERFYQGSGVIRETHTGAEISKVSEQARLAFEEAKCRFSPDGKLLAGGARFGIRIVDADTGNDRFYFAEGNVGNLMAFSPDGTRVATAGNDRSLRVYDLLSGKLLLNTFVDTPGIVVMGFQADGTTLVTATNLETKLWNCLELSEGQVAAAMNPVAVLGDAEVFCEGKDGSTRVLQKTNVQSNSVVERYQFPKQDVLDFEVCPTALVAALRTKTQILLWDLQANHVIAEIPSLSAYRMQFSRDGKWLAADSGFADPTVRLIDVSGGRVERRLEHSGTVARCLRFNEDSSRLYVGYQSGDVVAWDTTTGEMCWFTSTQSQAVETIEVAPNSRYVAAAGTEERIAILEPSNGVLIKQLEGHASHVVALAFHPSQPRLATAGADSEIRIWDTKTWEPIFQIPTPGNCKKLAFTQSGDRLFAFQLNAVISFDAKQAASREAKRIAWLQRSLARAEQFKNIYAIEWFLEKLVELEPNKEPLIAKLEQVRKFNSAAKQKRERTAVEAVKIENLSIRNLENAYVVVTNKVIGGDLDYVRQAANHIVGQIDDKTSGFSASLAYRLYLLCPGPKTEIENVFPGFEKRTKGYKSQFAAHLVRGGLQFRAGRYQDALESLKLAETFETDSKSHALSWLLLSMIHAELGQLTEAESWLGRAKRWRNSMSGFDYANQDYQVRLPFNILVLESEKLLAEKLAKQQAPSKNVK